MKCINYSTGTDSKETFLYFIRDQRRQSDVITKARILLFFIADVFNNGYFNGK